MSIYKFKEKQTSLPSPDARKLPSAWKGFNLLNMFYFSERNEFEFPENEFKIISEWGFNFIRIPMDYRCLMSSDDWYSINESAVSRLDKALDYGIKYDIHISLNLHRAPGYTVASPPEKTNLWTEKEPQNAFKNLWAYFAKRYRNIPNEYLDFNLVNEPANIDEASYAAVAKMAADSIWEHDSKRLIIADGLEYGTIPSEMIKNFGMAQSTRGYQPFTLTHYHAGWVEGSQDYPLPAWPSDAVSFNKTSLYETHFKKWDKLGCGVMAGEWGAHN